MVIFGPTVFYLFSPWLIFSAVRIRPYLPVRISMPINFQQTLIFQKQNKILIVFGNLALLDIFGFATHLH